MANDKHILDDVLRQAAEGMAVPPVFDKWEAIAGGLDRERRRRRAIVWTTIAVPLLVLLGYLGTSIFECKTVEMSAIEQSNPVTEPVLKDELSADQGQDRSEFVLPKSDFAPSAEEFTYPVHQPPHQPSLAEFIDSPPTSVDPGTPEKLDESDETTEPVEGHEKTVVETDVQKSVVQDDLPTPKEAIEKLPTNKSSSMNPGSGLLSGNLELGLSVSPGIASKLVSESSQFAWLINRNYKKSSGAERAAFSYQIDFYLNKYLSNNIYMGTGVRYTERAEQVDYNYKIDELVTVRTSEQKLIYTPLAPALVKQVSYSGLNRYQFLDVPVKLGYIAEINPQLGWRTEVGASFSYLMGVDVNKVHATTLELSTESDLAIQRINAGWSLQTGLIYPLGRSSAITVDALYSMNLGSWRAAEEGILEKPYNYGLMLGWKHKFVKP